MKLIYEDQFRENNSMPIMVWIGDSWDEIGKVVQKFMLYDVVFTYKDGVLYHYRGVFMGWILYGYVEVGSFEEAQKWVANWADDKTHREDYSVIIRY